MFVQIILSTHSIMAESRNPSGASHSTTLSEGLETALRFAGSPPSVARSPSPTMLSPKLSLRSVISTTSSFAERMNRARDKPASDKTSYRIIGRGTAGTIFEVPGTKIAVKKGSNVEALWTDYRLTNIVSKAFAERREMLQDLFPDSVIPKTASCLKFFMPDSRDYWNANLERFPTTHRSLGAAFEVDRILPIPQIERGKLIDRYFEQDAEIQEEAKNDERNKNCLIRVYLGENESEKQTQDFYDSLENFPMRLNMLEEHLVEDISILATEMAMALAILHWQAQVDGQDCEFVLGSSIALTADRRALPIFGSGSRPHEVSETRLFNRREINLWVLDFDKSLEIDLSAEDVDSKLVNSFFGNDPYYPRPDVDYVLWGHFTNAYLRASEAILRRRKVSDDILGLPRQFIDKVEKKCEEDKAWNPEEGIVFR